MSEAHALSAGPAGLPFVDLQEKEEEEAAPAARAAAHGTLYHGRHRFFSYDGSALKDKSVNSCGQQAIATTLDFWNAADFGLSRNYRGEGLADDGAYHYPPHYVEEVMRYFPPTNLFGMTFSTKENVAGALAKCKLKVGMIHSRAFGDGLEQETILRDWIAARRLPALCLMDNSQFWGKDGQLHWGIICGWSDQDVLLAGWGQVQPLTWPQFRAAWRCPGLPWPNNYLALFPYRPA